MVLKKGLTAHCVVRNEPFVWYAVKSVYDLVDEVLLYDTGSDDVLTANGVGQLVEWDAGRKLRLERWPLEDETRWRVDRGRSPRLQNEVPPERGVAWLRQKMIDDTRTEYFMVVDGDEVHYRANHAAVRRAVERWPDGMLCGVLPLVWFRDLTHTFWTTSSGRLFRTDGVCVTGNYPSEMHRPKGGGKLRKDSNTFDVQGAVPYAHFENYLKPWRRRVPPEQVTTSKGGLPEVMEENDEFTRRFDRALHG